jgi:hypothetical protein
MGVSSLAPDIFMKYPLAQFAMGISGSASSIAASCFIISRRNPMKVGIRVSKRWTEAAEAAV